MTHASPKSIVARPASWGTHETLQEKLDEIKPINVTSQRQYAIACNWMQLFSDASQLISEQCHYSGCITVKKMTCNCGRTLWRKHHLTQMCSEAALYSCWCWMSDIIKWSAINVRCLCSVFVKKKNPFEIHEIDNIASMWQWICHSRIVNKQNEVEKPFHDGFQTFPEDISQLV